VSTSTTALDLTKQFPRSPRDTLAGYIYAARLTDKCRAVVAGTNGGYHYAHGSCWRRSP